MDDSPRNLNSLALKAMHSGGAPHDRRPSSQQSNARQKAGNEHCAAVFDAAKRVTQSCADPTSASATASSMFEMCNWYAQENRGKSVKDQSSCPEDALQFLQCLPKNSCMNIQGSNCDAKKFLACAKRWHEATSSLEQRPATEQPVTGTGVLVEPSRKVSARVPIPMIGLSEERDFMCRDAADNYTEYVKSLEACPRRSPQALESTERNFRALCPMLNDQSRSDFHAMTKCFKDNGCDALEVCAVQAEAAATSFDKEYARHASLMTDRIRNYKDPRRSGSCLPDGTPSARREDCCSRAAVSYAESGKIGMRCAPQPSSKSFDAAPGASSSSAAPSAAPSAARGASSSAAPGASSSALSQQQVNAQLQASIDRLAKQSDAIRADARQNELRLIKSVLSSLQDEVQSMDSRDAASPGKRTAQRSLFGLSFGART